MHVVVLVKDPCKLIRRSEKEPRKRKIEFTLQDLHGWMVILFIKMNLYKN